MQVSLRLLEAVEPLGILRRAPKRGGERHCEQPLVPGPHPAPQSALTEPFRSLLPLQLFCVAAAQEVALWNEFVERDHPLGYRRPCGPHLRCLPRDRQGRTLGCMLRFRRPRGQPAAISGSAAKIRRTTNTCTWWFAKPAGCWGPRARSRLWPASYRKRSRWSIEEYYKTTKKTLLV